MIDILLEEISFGLPDARQFWRIFIRLLVAMLVGAVVGVQRERSGKPAGIRTHMLVALGAALFVIGPMEFGMIESDLSRVIQGLVTGIGFLGAGAILKMEDKREIEGLTTAAGIWMTAAMGLAAGLGRFGLALISVILAWFVLAVVKKTEYWLNRNIPDSNKEAD
ncbi:MAG: MgtC/SapB family protein [Candidatus Binatia bacterium]